MSPIALVFSGALLASAFSTQAFAAEVKFDQQTCYTGPAHLIQHADGMVSGSYAVIGTSPGTEGTPFRMMSGQCLGAFSDVSGQHDENGSCEFVDAAGDKFFGVYSRKGDPAKAEGTWRVVHGTGKFADISGGGKWMPIGNFPPSGMPNMFNGCNHEWGHTTSNNDARRVSSLVGLAEGGSTPRGCFAPGCTRCASGATPPTYCRLAGPVPLRPSAFRAIDCTATSERRLMPSHAGIALSY